jgi:hypothetical protein
MADDGSGSPEAVIGGYLDAMLKDATGAQIMVREYLDGAPFLAQLTAAEPSLLDPMRHAAAVIARDGAARARVDPVLAVVTVGGLAALVASAQEAVRPFVPAPMPAEAWRDQVLRVLAHGLAPNGGNGAVS